MSVPDKRAHWENVYGGKDDSEVSWYQESPAISLRLLTQDGPPPESSIIDIGGGASRLIDALLDAGFVNLTVLDIAGSALAQAEKRLGERAREVQWLVADITSWAPTAQYDIWHDRAVFHFLTQPEDRDAYRKALSKALKPGGLAVIGTFALDGPERCSGLQVVRYSPESLAAELNGGFRLVDSIGEDHRTPGGKLQRFQFSRFRRE